MTNTSDIKQQVRNYVMHGQLEKALQVLNQYVDDDYADESLMLLSRFNSMKRENMAGLLDSRDYQVAINKLSQSLLYLSEKIEFEDSKNGKKYYNSLERAQQKTNTNQNTLKVFYSYSRADRAYLEGLQKHLKVLERDGIIQTWHDGQILAGDNWDNAIMSQLRTADIILFLVSADFLSTDYIWTKEISVAMERHAEEDAIVVPIIVRPCLWEQTEFARLQATPVDRYGRLAPISKWEDKDDAFAIVAKDITQLILQRRNQKSKYF